MSWSESFNVRAVADHCPPIVLGLSCPLAFVDAGARLFERFAVVLAVCSLWLQPLVPAAVLPTEPIPGQLRVLVVTGGHDFEEEPLLAVFDRMAGIVWAHARCGEDAEHFLTSAVRRSLLWSAGNLKGGPQ